MPLDAAFVRQRLPGRVVEWHERAATTMTLAFGKPAGAIIGAEEQTAGQGRLGRSWHSARGAGLYFTLVLEPRMPPQQLPVLTLGLGLAVADAVQMLAGEVCDLRWPNDVMLNGRKLAGILAQLHGNTVLAGIGLNVNQPQFPAELARLATSLRIETGREHAREPLLVYIAQAVGSYVTMLETGGSGQLLRLFSSRSSCTEGCRVTVEDGGLTGTTAGLTAEGFLRLRTADGAEVTIHAGGVRPVEE